MISFLTLIVACNSTPKDVITMDDVISPTATTNNEPSPEPESEPDAYPMPDSEPDTNSLPDGYEDPDAFDSTCGPTRMTNNVNISVDNQTYSLNEAIWDIETFGFMIIVMGDSQESLCDLIQARNYSSVPMVQLLAVGKGMMASTETYDLTLGVTTGEPNEDASVSFENNNHSEIFTSGLIEIESYTYGADMTFNISAEGDVGSISGTDIKACYCPNALEIVANF